MRRGRLLGPGLALLLGCTLTLVACNSNSVSGSQPKASGSTTAETPKSATKSAQGSGSYLQVLSDKLNDPR